MVVLFNKGNRLMHGKVVLEGNTKGEIPKDIADLWIKMGMNVEVLVDESNQEKTKAPSKKARKK